METLAIMVQRAWRNYKQRKEFKLRLLEGHIEVKEEKFERTPQELERIKDFEMDYTMRRAHIFDQKPDDFYNEIHRDTM